MPTTQKRIRGADWHDGTEFSSADTVVIENTSDPALYETHRGATNTVDGFTYRIPVPTEGYYAVRLHFAEVYYGASAQEGDFVGQRVFDINIDGKTLSSGSYLYRMLIRTAAGEQSESGLLVLTK